MSDRDVVGTGTNVLTDQQKELTTAEALRILDDVTKDKTGEEYGKTMQEMLMGLTPEQRVHRFVQIADRGFASFRLKVNLPEDVYGEWIPDDTASIAEAQMKGFVIDDKYAINSGLHSDATGKPKVGDVIHMICPKPIKDAHDAAAKIRYDRVHARRKDLPEETNYNNQVKSLGLDTKFKGAEINQSSNAPIDQRGLLNTIRSGS